AEVRNPVDAGRDHGVADLTTADLDVHAVLGHGEVSDRGVRSAELDGDAFRLLRERLAVLVDDADAGRDLLAVGERDGLRHLRLLGWCGHVPDDARWNSDGRLGEGL